MRSHKMIGRFGVDLDTESFLGDTRVRLLEAIGRTGSISQAAKEVPLSYKAAWDALDAMNNLAQFPLVERAVGGRHGGGTFLTNYGRQVITLYRAMESEYQQALDRIASLSNLSGSLDAANLRRLLRSVSFTTSAGNQFAGPVSALRAGEVTYEVSVRLDRNNEIVAHISKESAEQMRLNIGREVTAWVNASSIILVTDETLRLSARNKLWGEVMRIHEGPVAVDVVLSVATDKTVSALITRDALKDLALTEGSRVCAAFKASAVTLAVFD